MLNAITFFNNLNEGFGSNNHNKCNDKKIMMLPSVNITSD